jgi:hypothetical protein
MKTVVKCIKTAAVTALFASTAMLSATASAIEVGSGDTIISYANTWQQAQTFCANTGVNCLSTTAYGQVWRIVWTSA